MEKEKFIFFFIDLTRGTNLWKNEQTEPHKWRIFIAWMISYVKPRFGGFCDVALRYSDRQCQCHLKEIFQINSHRTCQCHAIPGLPCPSEALLWCPSNNLKCRMIKLDLLNMGNGGPSSVHEGMFASKNWLISVWPILGEEKIHKTFFRVSNKNKGVDILQSR